MSHGQTLGEITARVMAGLDRSWTPSRPDAVIVQGDTTTAFVGRAGRVLPADPGGPPGGGPAQRRQLSPFPEEANRKITSQIAALHLAPTPRPANLLAEGVPPTDVVVTGNTVIDALLAVSAPRPAAHGPGPRRDRGDGRRIVLVTAHRRESWGDAMEGVGRAHRAGSPGEFPDVRSCCPSTATPWCARRCCRRSTGLPNVTVTEPLGYGEFCPLMRAGHPGAHRLRRGPGGGAEPGQAGAGHAGQHRAPRGGRGRHRPAGRHRRGARSSTEVRPAADDDAAYAAMAQAVNPYGDGRSAGRVLDATARMLAPALPDALPDLDLDEEFTAATAEGGA